MAEDRWIDLNCDLGESEERVRDGTDRALLDVVTSANIACGGHAGDSFTMGETVRLAIERGVAIGAHPSYPDLAGFGRVEMAMSEEAVEETVAQQIAALSGIVRTLGGRITHVKPHGALYHCAMMREPVARAIARASAGDVMLVGLAGAAALGWWRGMGRRTIAEAFADRRYERDGSLRARTKPGAVLTDVKDAVDQAVSIARGRGVVAFDGAVVPVRAETICIHGDSPGAVEVAKAVRAGLEAVGVRVRAPMA